MTVEIDETTGIWAREEAGDHSSAFSQRQALLERLAKANGHVNAAERKVWAETERGLWSGRQAMARVVEVWLVLSGQLTELPPAGRYLKKDLLRTRLEEASAMPKPSKLATLWREVTLAEEAICGMPFPMLSTPLSKSELDELHAGLERQRRYIYALRELVLFVESEFADRFLALQPGDLVNIKDVALANHLSLNGFLWHAKRIYESGVTGIVFMFQGLTAWVFYPLVAEVDWNEAVRHYDLIHKPVTHVGPTANSVIRTPSYYWLMYAGICLRQAKAFLIKQGEGGLPDICDALFDALDAMAKAWWLSFAPGQAPLGWRHRTSEFVYALERAAPGEIARPLSKSMRRVEALSQWHLEPQSENNEPERRLQLAVVLEAIKPVLGRLEALVEPRIDLAVNDCVLLYGCMPARITKRDGLRLWLDMGWPAPVARYGMGSKPSGEPVS